LQIFGNDIMKEDLGKRIPLYKETVGDGIWVKIFLNWYKKQDKTKDYVLTDLRFPIERRALCTLDNVVFIKTVSDRSPEDTHKSESFIHDMPVDYTIVNNGYNTYYQYYDDIREVMRRIQQCSKCYTKTK